jgi:MFS family permease
LNERLRVPSQVSGTPTEREDVGHQWRVLGTLTFGTVSFLVGQLVLAPLLPTIVAEFDITLAEVSGALTVMWACAALAMYPGSLLSDRFSRRIVLVAATVVGSLGLVLATVAPVFPIFVVALAFLGIGIGLYEPTSMATIADLFTSARGRAFGVVSASYNVGSGAAAGVVIVALWLGPWRYAFLPALGGLLVVAVQFHRWLSGPYVLHRMRLTPQASLRRVLTTFELRLLLALFCLYMFLWQGTISFFPTLLQAELTATPTQATLAFATIFAIGLITSPIMGALGDRFGHQRVGLLSPLVGAIGLSILLAVPTQFGLIVGTVTFSLGLVTFWPVMTAELIDGLADSTMGADYGATRAIFYAVGSLGLTYVGVIAERYSYVVAYTGFVGCFFFAAIVLAVLATSGR